MGKKGKEKIRDPRNSKPKHILHGSSMVYTCLQTLGPVEPSNQANFVVNCNLCFIQQLTFHKLKRGCC